MAEFEPGSIVQVTREELENMVSRMIRPTTGLRFIERDGRRILQQAFEVQLWKGGNCISSEGDWQDVPFVENP